MSRRDRWAVAGLAAILWVATSGCTSVQRLSVEHYKADPNLLVDGEEVEVITVAGEVFRGTVAKRTAEELTLRLPGGSNMVFPVASIAYFQAEKFSAPKTAGLVVGVAVGLALIYIIIGLLVSLATVGIVIAAFGG